ncbi:hypothetical protein [Chryseolinea sp. H1M3-3]|uniref:hypothetical protein n=1 Tax=Chryseolinea sp. H1M3-3 TaxID=3034144 RepID=UPI0023ECF33A|nr:hypothetical protein [Chryseolinea sp. H1M3-3]
MKILWVAIIFFSLLQDQVPFKPTDEFQLKLDLQFKKRPYTENHTIEMEKRTLPTSGMDAPYLYIDLLVIKPLPEEVRIKVNNNKGENLLTRKFDSKVKVRLDLGFTDDIKDRATAHQYIITFFTKDKTPSSRIEIFFEEDGTYLVNGEKRGKI